MALQGPSGIIIPCNIIDSKGRRGKRNAKIGKGWKQFYSLHSLKVGQVLIINILRRP